MITGPYKKTAEHNKHVDPNNKNKKGITCTNSLDLKDIRECIDTAFRQQEPAELIFAHIETLPNVKEKANMCRELSQKYWQQNTRIGRDLSLKFDKLAKQFENPIEA